MCIALVQPFIFKMGLALRVLFSTIEGPSSPIETLKLVSFSSSGDNKHPRSMYSREMICFLTLSEMEESKGKSKRIVLMREISRSPGVLSSEATACSKACGPDWGFTDRCDSFGEGPKFDSKLSSFVS